MSTAAHTRGDIWKLQKLYVVGLRGHLVGTCSAVMYQRQNHNLCTPKKCSGDMSRDMLHLHVSTRMVIPFKLEQHECCADFIPVTSRRLE